MSIGKISQQPCLQRATSAVCDGCSVTRLLWSVRSQWRTACSGPSRAAPRLYGCSCSRPSSCEASLVLPASRWLPASRATTVSLGSPQFRRRRGSWGRAVRFYARMDGRKSTRALGCKCPQSRHWRRSCVWRFSRAGTWVITVALHSCWEAIAPRSGLASRSLSRRPFRRWSCRRCARGQARARAGGPRCYPGRRGRRSRVAVSLPCRTIQTRRQGLIEPGVTSCLRHN
mmetsp:Transcript_118909/g.296667  ORF Transcript_118909/g.296667 Transcript_118909/m.296667 type:complete len:229 (-) Transcript_118909:158-844(-)